MSIKRVIQSMKKLCRFKYIKTTSALIGMFFVHTLPTLAVEVNSPVADLGIENPLGNGTTLSDLIISILNALIIIAIPVIVIFIVYAGFLYVTAQGNADKVRTATRALTYAIIGAVLIIAAVTITEIIGSTVNEFRSP